MRIKTLNTRERLAHLADWLGWIDEDLSFGLRSVADAEKLFLFWEARQDELPEMPDEWKVTDLKRAIGYNPFDRSQELHPLYEAGA